MSKTYITSEPDSFWVFLKKIWRYRSLVWVFAVRDLQVKYAQTSLGFLWSLIQPLTALLIFTFFFEYLLELDTKELPYAIHVLSGLVGWNFFTYVVNAGSGSVSESSDLIRKIYFPKSILPLSKVIVGGVDMLIAFGLLIPLAIYYKVSFSFNLVFLPLVILFNLVCGLALVFTVSAFAVKKRDLFHLLPFVVYFGIWLTPVFFHDGMLPTIAKRIMLLNPMASVIQLWRWSVFGVGELHLEQLISFVVVTAIFITAMYRFNIEEGEQSDYA